MADLSPLAGASGTLQRLRILRGIDPLTDLAPLASCTALRLLDLRGCRSHVVSVLAALNPDLKVFVGSDEDFLFFYI